jgi:hypothetical protein
MTYEYVPPAFSEHIKTAPPEVLYHYTGQAGLLGIVEQKALWCTKVQYMNDSTEFGLALDMARATLKKIIQETLLDDADRIEIPGAFLKGETCFKLSDSLRGLEEANLFAVCFCECGDLLSQWRGYAGGGQGYAVEFDTETLKRAAQAKEFILGMCIYDPDVQQRIVDQAIQYCLDVVSAVQSPEQWIGLGPLADILSRCGPFFKEPSFKEEREWRLISPIIWHPYESVAFRPGRSMITPYFKLPIASEGNLPIRRVVVGPCPHMELSKQSVTNLLVKSGVSVHGQEVAIGSKIPFRNW